ncbi:MAG TPA: D-cysteine desulfhydrase [Steroidobacteraceae bacterium]|nr:D-cysteine desulfhydrase [Steroidobacteraceae bacterium]
MIDLSSFPRVRLAHLPTPLEPMDRVSKHLGGPRLWVKRDDCTGVATGGNKVRKLEFVLADALAKGADTVVTAGAWQSNHSRQTAAAAARLGLKCHLLLWNMTGFSEAAYRQNGNVLLDRLHGATIHELKGPDKEDVLTYLNSEVDGYTQRLEQQGHRPYPIPVGASNPVGALGYVECAREIIAQARDLGLKIDAIVHRSGSAGTQAGLVAGLAVSDVHIPVIGIGGGKAPKDLEEMVFQMAGETASLLGNPSAVERSAVVAIDPHPIQYGHLTPEVADVIRLFARSEGILVDPAYTGPALVGMNHLIRQGKFKGASNVVFIHTGGTAALFGYVDSFAAELDKIEGA